MPAQLTFPQKEKKKLLFQAINSFHWKMLINLYSPISITQHV